MREADLSRHGAVSSADERRARRAVMRRAKRALPNHTPPLGCTCDGMDLCDLQGFFIGQLRQDGGNRARKHGFTRARRADKQNIMPARNSDLGRPLRALLPFDFAKIRRISLLRPLPTLGGMRRNLFISAHMFTKLGKRTNRQNGDALHIGRFLCVSLRHSEYRLSLGKRVNHHRQHTRDGTNPSVQAQLTKRDKLRPQVRAKLARSREDGERNRQMVHRAFFSHVRWREIDRDARCGENISGILNRRSNALAGFLHRRVRQANNFKRRQTVCNIRLHLNAKSPDSV
ncbi:hypothetical protein SDC9_157013 [bioreactor metagenome]|uniref:Uncharacterized protein n=1 Tax=bioreactor metagenome TaxID=1076179 RepID=A0A645F629_9ZZZZ